MKIPTKIRKHIRSHINCDKIIFKKDDTVVFKRTFYYRHGMTGTKYGEGIREQLVRENLSDVFELVHAIEDWNNWPKTSYFVATFKMKEKTGV